MIFLRKNYSQTKQIVRFIKLIIPAQGASLMPPIGPTLAQFGLNINDFSNNFNEYIMECSFYPEQMNLKIMIILYIDKSYDFVILGSNIATLINEIFIKFDMLNINIKAISLVNFTKLFFYQQSYILLPSRSIIRSLLASLKSMKIFIKVSNLYYINFFGKIFINIKVKEIN